MTDVNRVEYVWADGPMKGHRQLGTRGEAEKLLGQTTTFRVPRSMEFAVYRFEGTISDDRKVLLRFVKLGTR